MRNDSGVTCSNRGNAYPQNNGYGGHFSGNCGTENACIQYTLVVKVRTSRLQHITAAKFKRTYKNHLYFYIEM
jgi:hypothetical protein